MPCPSRASGPTTRARKKLLPLGHALLLGALHGPAELLPVSSSGHLTALPWLLGWPYPDLDAEVRKSFEVALHAGSATAWLLSSGAGGPEGQCPREPQALLFLGLAVAPAGAAGLIWERQIEQHLGRPAVIALGLALGGLGMIAADRLPQRRSVEDVGPPDGAWLGAAQACALLPGISRTGATLAAARARGFGRRAAWELSARVGAPVIGGAAALKLVRLLQRRPPLAQTAGLLAGGGASFASTLVAARVLRPLDRGWSLWPFAAYRLALALAIATRLRRSD